MPNFIAEERWIGVWSVFSLRIDGDQTVGAIVVKKGYLFGSLQNFKWHHRHVVTRSAASDAQALRIDGCGLIMLCGRLSRWGERQFPVRQILADVPKELRIARALPISGQVGVFVGRSEEHTSELQSRFGI